MPEEVRVEDEENVVDQKTKEQILSLREAVDNDERNLYVDRVRSPEWDYTRQDANRDWGLSVRQYLRGIKRLWGQDGGESVRNVETYWEARELANELYYPPNQNGYQFNLAQYSDEYSDAELRRAIGLSRGCDIPLPFRFQLHGLGDVLTTKRIQHTWVINVDKTGPPPTHKSETVHLNMPIPKHILENAVETADEFLQQAGIGFNTTVPDYMGGEEPGL